MLSGRSPSSLSYALIAIILFGSMPVCRQAYAAARPAGRSRVAMPIPSGAPRSVPAPQSARASTSAYAPDEVLVRLREDEGPALAKFLTDHELTLRQRVRTIRTLRVGIASKTTVPETIARLRSDPRVLLVQPNFSYRISIWPQDPQCVDLPATPNQYGVFLTKLPSLWKGSNGGAGKTIAIIDTGADLTHPDLAPNLWTNPGEVPGNNLDDDANGYADDIHGWDIVNQDAVPNDDNNHGTHVTGIACAATNSSSIAGVAPNAQFIPIKSLNASGNSFSLFIAEGLEYARGVGADIINMSFNVSVPEIDPEADCIVREACARATKAGAILVGSSGNNSSPSVEMPASFDGVISVGAVDASEVVPDFSSYGTSLDVVAPGVTIWSTFPGTGVDTLSGTSQAAPFVSGVCALLLDYFPAAKAWEIEDYLRKQTRDVDPTPQNRDGHGLVSFGSLRDYSTGTLPEAWSFNTFHEWLGNRVSGETSRNDVGLVGTNDNDDDLPDLDGIPNTSANPNVVSADGGDDGLFPSSFDRLPIRPPHIFMPTPPLDVDMSVGNRSGPRYAGGAQIKVRAWVDWNSNNLFTDPPDQIFTMNSGPALWGANSNTVSVLYTPPDDHYRGNPMRFRARLYGPADTPGASTSSQPFGEVEDQAVLNFVEDFDMPDFHPSIFATLTGLWGVIPDDPPVDYFLHDPEPHHGLWHYAFVDRQVPCPIPQQDDLLIPENGAPSFDVREMTKCFLRFWSLHAICTSCGVPADNCRIGILPFTAAGVPLPEVTVYEFPETLDFPGFCGGSGPTMGEVQIDLSAFVGGYFRIVIHHDITNIYDRLAIDDVVVWGYDDAVPGAVAFTSSSMTNGRLATASWNHPADSGAPSDRTGHLYGAKLWSAGGSWPVGFPLTPRDFTNGFPVPGPLGSPITKMLNVPSVFPTYSFAARMEDELTLQAQVATTAFSTTPTFQVNVTTPIAEMIVQPGDTLKIPFITTSLGNALDAIGCTATDQLNWLSCSTEWVHVLSPSGGAVESLEVAVPLSALPGTTNLVAVFDTSLSNTAQWDSASTLLRIEDAPPCFHLAEHDTGNVRFSITDKGVHGFPDYYHASGSGFVFPKTGGANRLFIGGFWASADSLHVMNSEHALDNEDWVPIGCISLAEPAPPGGEFGTGAYDDGGHPTPAGLEVTQRSYAWGPGPNEDFVILIHDVKNTSGSAIEDLWVAEYMDWDVGIATQNKGATSIPNSLIYMHGASGVESESLHVGIKGLYPSPAAQLGFVDNAAYIYATNFLPDADRFHFIRGDLPAYTQDVAPVAADWSTVVGMGPFTVAAGDSIEVAFALVGGASLADLLVNAAASQNAWIEFFDPRTDVSLGGEARPTRLELSGGIPNPFARATRMMFGVPRDGPVDIAVFDVSGRKVTTLFQGPAAAGRHSVVWEGRDSRGLVVPAGVYFVRLGAVGEVRTEKIVRVK